jgi:hypothetical protein
MAAMIGREKMRFRPGTLKSSRDTVVVIVFWGDENSYSIALIRRSDAATAFVDIPQELRGEFARFDRAIRSSHDEIIRGMSPA